MSGAGIGIGSTRDQFAFVYRALTADATIVARVSHLQNASANAQAGVMIRQGLDAPSTYAAVLLSKTNQIMFKRRTRSAQTTINSRTPVTVSAAWVKLDRRGGTITASWSADGASWTVLGAADVPMNNVVYVGLAVTSYTEVAATRAAFTGVQVTAPSGGPLPTGWRSNDIGSPGRPGAASYQAGTFTLRGGGSGISGTWDQFRYAYAEADGDVDIVARVRDLGQANSLSKAGVMIRDSLTPNGAHASMFVTAGAGTLFQRRQLAGGATGSSSGTATPAPIWFKLSLRSGVVTGYQSMDGVNWLRVGRITLTLPSPFYVGLAVTSRDDTTTVTTNIDNVRILSVAPAPNDPPTVSLTTPAAGALFTAPATIAISATAGDQDGAVSRVDFFAGSTLIGSDTTAPYSAQWNNVPAGTYTLTAVATDNDQATATSAARTVTVNQRPTVSLTAPASGAIYTAPAAITLSASASDTDGSIARVDFYRGSTLIGSDVASPYSVTWSNAPAGTYSLTAVATDDDGATATSAARSVTVNSATNQLPTVSLTAPANGATFTAPATITVSANASDTGGAIARVEFYAGSTLIGTDTTSPYSIAWSNVPAGSYSLTARATDNAGATVTSAARSVTVTQSLPSGWTAVDIGQPAIAGSTSYSSGTFTIRAGGTDIWGTADQFHYVHRQVSGDFDAVGRVVSVQEAHPWSKAGVMIRASLASDAANASMFVSASQPLAYQRRTVTGGTTATTNVPGDAPTWVKLARRGATITASTSVDGTTWSVVDTATMTLPASFYVGVAVSSVNATTATVAIVDNVTVATVANQPPTVSLTAPANGATFPGPATITINATAADGDGSISRVEFYRGSTLIGSDTTSPYSVTWSNVAAGTYTLTARAIDSGGATTTSAPRTVTVSGTSAQRRAVFTASPDHAALVSGYVFEVFAQGANPATAIPIATQDLGKPAIVSGDCSADITATLNGLAPGTYQATVSAVGSGGRSRSAPVTFTR